MTGHGWFVALAESARLGTVPPADALRRVASPEHADDVLSGTAEAVAVLTAGRDVPPLLPELAVAAGLAVAADHPAEAERLLEAGLRAAGPAADPDVLLRGRVELLSVLGRTGRGVNGVAETAALLPLVEPHPDQLLLGRVLLAHGRALRAGGRAADAVAAFERAHAIFTGPAPDVWRAGGSQYELALAHRTGWKIDPALAALDEAVRLLDRAGLPHDLAVVLHARAFTVCRCDWFDTPLPVGEDGKPVLTTETWERGAGPYARATRAADILADLSRAADLVRPLPASRPLLAQLLSDRALFLAGRGRIDEAVAAMSEAVEATDTPEKAASRRACQGEFLQVTGRYAEAVEWYAEAARLHTRGTDADGRRAVLESLARSAEAAGLFATARDAYRRLRLLGPSAAPPADEAGQQLEADAAAGRFASVEYLARRMAGQHSALAEARARLDDPAVSEALAAVRDAADAPPSVAVDLLGDALRTLEASGFTILSGMARHARATALTADGDRAGAADDLAAAVAAFARGGAWFPRVMARHDRLLILRYLARFDEFGNEYETFQAELRDEEVWSVPRMAARRAAGDRPEEVRPDSDEDPFATHQAEVEAWVARVYDGPMNDDSSAHIGLVMVYTSLLHARAAGDRLRTLGSLFSLVQILSEVGRPLEALRAADELADMATDDEPTWMRAMWSLHRGIAEVRAGRYAQGQVTLEWALTNLPEQEAPGVAHGRAMLGEAYLHLGQYGLAWECLDDAVRRLDAIQQELAAHVARQPPWPVGPPGQTEASRLLQTVIRVGTNARMNAGLLFLQTEDFDDAEHLLLECLGRVEEDDDQSRATIEMNLSLVERSRGRLPAAAERLASALAAFERFGAGVMTNLCRQNLAQASRLLGDLPRALDLSARIDPTVFSHGQRMAYHLGYAMVLADTGRGPDALAQLRQASAAHRLALGEAGGGELALDYLGQKNDVVGGAAALALTYGDPIVAYELLQAAKGLLAQQFLSDRSPPRVDSPAVLAARERVVARLGRGPAIGPDPMPEYLALTRAATVRPAPDSGPAPLAAEPGRTVEAVQAALPPGWVLLDFLQLDADDLRVFVVTRDRVETVRLDLSRGGEPFRLRLRLLAAQLEDVSRRPDGWTRDADRVWDDLYDHLFRPLEPHLAGCDGLYLVPHGFWHAVPLHAARTRDRATAKHVFLQDRFLVAYLPAAAALPHLPPPVGRPSRCLSLANPERGTAHTLPFADWEAAELAARFPAGRFLAGPDATAARADGWADADLVHFGCHGTGDESFAGLSRLYLAGGDCLLAHDVLYRRGPLRSGAVVLLNGCQTGVKDWRAVDESMGLMTAFLLRGAGAVLATQWHVGDYFAARAVAGFADRLAGGADPNDALRGGLRAARAVRPDQVTADCDALLARFPADRFPHEAAQLGRLRATAATRSSGDAPAAAGWGANDPLAWAAFQLVGRIA